MGDSQELDGLLHGKSIYKWMINGVPHLRKHRSFHKKKQKTAARRKSTTSKPGDSWVLPMEGPAASPIRLNRMWIQWQHPQYSTQVMLTIVKHIYLGKLEYFTNLNSSAIWGWFPLLTMIPGFGRTVRSWSNLPRSKNNFWASTLDKGPHAMSSCEFPWQRRLGYDP